MTDTARNQFATSVKDAVKDALICVQSALQENKNISSVFDWPDLRWNKNGMPQITTSRFDGPLDYSSVLAPHRWMSEVQPDPTVSLSSFDVLESLIVKTDNLRLIDDI